MDEQKKVDSVKEFYENQEERAKQFAERTSQNFVTVRKLQLLSEWISLSCLRENSVLRSVVILSFLYDNITDIVISSISVLFGKMDMMQCAMFSPFHFQNIPTFLT